jgi:hypothetical protein
MRPAVRACWCMVEFSVWFCAWTQTFLKFGTECVVWCIVLPAEAMYFQGSSRPQVASRRITDCSNQIITRRSTDLKVNVHQKSKRHCSLHSSTQAAPVLGLWNPITLRNLDDEGDIFSETSVRTRVTWYKIPKGLYNWYHRESIPEDNAIRPLTVSFYGEPDQRWFHGNKPWNPKTRRILKMEALCSPKRRFQLMIHCTEFKKALQLVLPWKHPRRDCYLNINNH